MVGPTDRQPVPGRMATRSVSVTVRPEMVIETLLAWPISARKLTVLRAAAANPAEAAHAGAATSVVEATAVVTAPSVARAVRCFTFIEPPFE
ncbi:hypothetical protein Aph02nite_70200 [Actinoplanes philippinensis]|nr:hypothetical protein Aph02nite_70200 [Actinoplanes philippinensis]